MTKQVLINGITLSYKRFGRGKPLMLIHGFPLNYTCWNSVASLLAVEFDIIMPDLRGFGQSSSVEEPYTITAMADDLAGLLDALGIEKTALAGHSMGGYVALAFAQKYPQRVAGLGLVSSQAAADAPERKEGRYKTANEVAEKGVGIVAEAMISKLSDHAKVQTFVHDVIEKQTSSGVIGALKAMAERDDMQSVLSAFDFPFLLIHGDADVLIPVDRAREAAALVPSAKLVEIPGAGHMPMMEFPEATADALRFFAG